MTVQLTDLGVRERVGIILPVVGARHIGGCHGRALSGESAGPLHPDLALVVLASGLSELIGIPAEVPSCSNDACGMAGRVEYDQCQVQPAVVASDALTLVTRQPDVDDAAAVAIGGDRSRLPLSSVSPRCLLGRPGRTRDDSGARQRFAPFIGD